MSALACGAQGKRTALLLKLGIFCVAAEATGINSPWGWKRKFTSVMKGQEPRMALASPIRPSGKSQDVLNNLANGRPGQQAFAEDPLCAQLWEERADMAPAWPHHPRQRTVMWGTGVSTQLSKPLRSHRDSGSQRLLLQCLPPAWAWAIPHR